MGTGTNTYRMAGITSAASLAAQTGPTYFTTTDANGNLATSAFGPADIGILQKQMKQGFEGSAIAIAMGGNALPSDKKFAVSANWGTFRNQNALAVAAQMRVTDYAVINVGVGGGFQQGGVGGRAGVTFAW
jgi:hypothetical protein